MHKNNINTCRFCGEELDRVPRDGLPHMCLLEIESRTPDPYFAQRETDIPEFGGKKP